MLVSLRPLLAALTGAAALLAAAGCGGGEAPRPAPVLVDGAVTLSPSSAAAGETPPPAVTPAPGSATPSPSPTATTKPARTRTPTTKPARTTTTPTAASGKIRIGNLGLTVPNASDGLGKPVSGIHQQGCGSPDSANVWWTITVPLGRFRETWYEYEVSAPTPLRGRSDEYEMVVRGDRASIKTVIGPLARKAGNAGGGKLTITAVAVDNRNGDRVTTRMTATLLPCD